MMKIFLFIFLLLRVSGLSAQLVNKVDPNHISDGGYGYLLNQDKTAGIWWCEGSYKVLRDAPIPMKKSMSVEIKAAKNEYESFIMVIHPNLRMDNVRIEISSLTHTDGVTTFDSEKFQIKKVEYVKVTKPTDSYGFQGYWPDPLPEYNVPQTLTPGENHPFWITVKIPSEAKAGNYTGKLTVSSGNWIYKTDIKILVWDFALPKSPRMRSGFGLNMNNIKKYDNIYSKEDELLVFDQYMQAFRDYKISPYNPFEYAPIEEKVTGVSWQGGFYDTKNALKGNYGYKLTDNSATANAEASHTSFIPVDSKDMYLLSWMARTSAEKLEYVVGIECYDTDKNCIIFENRYDIFSTHQQWKPDTLRLGTLHPDTKYLKLKLFATNRTKSGELKGTIWYDDIALIHLLSGKNILSGGDFEVETDKIDIQLDFTRFNEAGRKYFDDYGFTGYNLRLKGLGSGTYYERENGKFEGFEQGTPEYNKLMERYLSQMQENLEKNGWLGKEYIYWFDEPGEADYEFVKNTNALIKKYAPGMTTFLTEHVAGQDISDVTDISCTIWHKLDHEKIKKMNEKGLEHWSYLCCWPKSPWLSEFIDHDAINMRMWLWASCKHQLKGVLIWETTYWNSEAASPAGHLQNPWEEAMSFVNGYGWPSGKQTIWGNGDGRYFYPNNRKPGIDKSTYTGKPIPSLRLELLRDGIEDYEYMVILQKEIQKADKRKGKLIKEAMAVLDIPESIYMDEMTYTKNPLHLYQHRQKIAEMIVRLGE